MVLLTTNESNIVNPNEIPEIYDLRKKVGDYVITYKPDEYCCDFTVCKIICYEENPDKEGVFDIPNFGEMDTGISDDITSAEIPIKGPIKWDGCSNWNYMTDKCLAHFCGLEKALAFNSLMSEMYAIANEVIPRANKDLMK